MIDAREEYQIRERVRACETMLAVQAALISQIDVKLDTVVEYVNTRKGAFRVAERIGVFFMTVTGGVVGAVITWLHSK